jgi:hypothetical protein
MGLPLLLLITIAPGTAAQSELKSAEAADTADILSRVKAAIRNLCKHLGASFNER